MTMDLISKKGKLIENGQTIKMNVIPV